jgi:hypothetical protein
MASIVTPASAINQQRQEGAPVTVAAVPLECAYCRSPIASGQRWVREKIYEPFADDAPRYRRYHADLFAGEELCCWEKHELELEIVRTARPAGHVM